MTNTVIIITGATASGKTALSLQLAEHLNTDIISADSRQCFRELGIGVAKPTPEELARVKHYFINSHSIHDNITAQVFEQYALQAVDEIFKKSQFAVMVGGTGLYIKAFCDGLDEIPALDGEIRLSIIHQYKEKGLAWLQQEIMERDPAFWQVAEQQNPHRLIRALEVKQGTGQSILFFQKKQQEKRPFNIVKIGIDLPRNQLYDNVNTRVDDMMARGLEKEALSLLPYRYLNALQTVGYKELFDFFDGNITMAQAVTQLKTNTRHYAKRQLTWFKKDTSIRWKPHFTPDFILQYAAEMMDMPADQATSG